MAPVFAENYEAIFSVESRGLWKRCDICEEKGENWEFVE